MANFQRRPATLVIFQANQFDGHNPCQGVIRDLTTGKAHVHTIQGQMVEIKAREWAIQEPDGDHYYPCADDIFQQRYELAEE